VTGKKRTHRKRELPLLCLFLFFLSFFGGGERDREDTARAHKSKRAREKAAKKENTPGRVGLQQPSVRYEAWYFVVICVYRWRGGEGR